MLSWPLAYAQLAACRIAALIDRQRIGVADSRRDRANELHAGRVDGDGTFLEVPIVRDEEQTVLSERHRLRRVDAIGNRSQRPNASVSVLCD